MVRDSCVIRGSLLYTLPRLACRRNLRLVRRPRLQIVSWPSSSSSSPRHGFSPASSERQRISSVSILNDWCTMWDFIEYGKTRKWSIPFSKEGVTRDTDLNPLNHLVASSPFSWLNYKAPCQTWDLAQAGGLFWDYPSTWGDYDVRTLFDLLVLHIQYGKRLCDKFHRRWFFNEKGRVKETGRKVGKKIQTEPRLVVKLPHVVFSERNGVVELAECWWCVGVK